jgi:hypothetical protein
MATRLLSLNDADDAEIVKETKERLSNERERVRIVCKEEIEKMLTFGAGICEMKYWSKSSNSLRVCINAKDMRAGWINEKHEIMGNTESLLQWKVQQVHWMFNELPWAVHQDVTTNRKSHRDLVVEKLMKEFNCVFETAEVRDQRVNNIFEYMYTRVFNDKKQSMMRMKDESKHDTIATWRRTKHKTTYYIKRTEPNEHKGVETEV